MESILTTETLREIFRNYDSNLQVVNFDIKPKSDKAHYCSIMFLIEIATKHKIDGKTKKLTIRFKTIPENPLRIEFINDSKYFVKEISMYRDVFPEIMEPVGVTSYPKCYHAVCDGQKDYIAMEDLAEDGYQIFNNRTAGLDEQHTKLVLQKLAEFHAASFIKFKGDGEKLQNSYPEIKEHFWKRNGETNEIPEMNRMFIENTANDIKNLLMENQLANEIPKIEILFVQNGFETVSKLATINSKFPSVIIHGDAWITNFLFKYNDKEVPVDLKFVDFQMPRVCSRLTDLAYFIYTSVDNETLNEKLEDLLKIYFESFNNFCQNHGMGELPLKFGDEELTFDLFLEEWNIYKHFGHFFALLLIPVMYAENPPDMEELDESDLRAEGPGELKKNNSFKELWNCKKMQDKLLNFILNHLSNV